MSSIEVDSQDNVINHSVLSSKKNSLIDKTISKKEELDNNASEASFSFSKFRLLILRIFSIDVPIHCFLIFCLY